LLRFKTLVREVDTSVNTIHILNIWESDEITAEAARHIRIGISNEMATTPFGVRPLLFGNPKLRTCEACGLFEDSDIHEPNCIERGPFLAAHFAIDAPPSTGRNLFLYRQFKITCIASTPASDEAGATAFLRLPPNITEEKMALFQAKHTKPAGSKHLPLTQEMWNARGCDACGKGKHEDPEDCVPPLTPDELKIIDRARRKAIKRRTRKTKEASRSLKRQATPQEVPQHFEVEKEAWDFVFLKEEGGESWLNEKRPICFGYMSNEGICKNFQEGRICFSPLGIPMRHPHCHPGTTVLATTAETRDFMDKKKALNVIECVWMLRCKAVRKFCNHFHPLYKFKLHLDKAKRENRSLPFPEIYELASEAYFNSNHDVIEDFRRQNPTPVSAQVSLLGCRDALTKGRCTAPRDAHGPTRRTTSD
jgi:hypothetical protein